MSNRKTITTQLKTDLAAITTAGGYNNDFENVRHWMAYPGDGNESFWINIRDTVNTRDYSEGYREILTIEIFATFKLHNSTTSAEEEAYYSKADSVIEDILNCLSANEDTYKTLLSESAFMFQPVDDEIMLDADENGGITGEARVTVEAYHKIQEVWS